MVVYSRLPRLRGRRATGRVVTPRGPELKLLAGRDRKWKPFVKAGKAAALRRVLNCGQATRSRRVERWDFGPRDRAAREAQTLSAGGISAVRKKTAASITAAADCSAYGFVGGARTAVVTWEDSRRSAVAASPANLKCAQEVSGSGTGPTWMRPVSTVTSWPPVRMNWYSARM